MHPSRITSAVQGAVDFNIVHGTFINDTPSWHHLEGNKNYTRMPSPNRGENKKSLKPPPSYGKCRYSYTIHWVFGFDSLFFFFETNKTKRTNTETSQQPTKTRPFFEAMKPLLLKQIDEKKWFIILVEIGKMTAFVWSINVGFLGNF